MKVMKNKKFYLLPITVILISTLQSMTIASVETIKDSIEVQQKTKDCRYPPCE